METLGLIYRYLELDADLIKAPLAVASDEHGKDVNSSHIPYPAPSQLIHGLTERVGTTALTAIVDAKADTVHVINLGDSRAVAGWYNPKTGLWRAEVLNSEHSSSNPDEQAR